MNRDPDSPKPEPKRPKIEGAQTRASSANRVVRGDKPNNLWRVSSNPNPVTRYEMEVSAPVTADEIKRQADELPFVPIENLEGSARAPASPFHTSFASESDDDISKYLVSNEPSSAARAPPAHPSSSSSSSAAPPAIPTIYLVMYVMLFYLLCAIVHDYLHDVSPETNVGKIRLQKLLRKLAAKFDPPVIGTHDFFADDGNGGDDPGDDDDDMDMGGGSLNKKQNQKQQQKGGWHPNGDGTWSPDESDYNDGILNTEGYEMRADGKYDKIISTPEKVKKEEVIKTPDQSQQIGPLNMTQSDSFKLMQPEAGTKGISDGSPLHQLEIEEMQVGSIAAPQEVNCLGDKIFRVRRVIPSFITPGNEEQFPPSGPGGPNNLPPNDIPPFNINFRNRNPRNNLVTLLEDELLRIVLGVYGYLQFPQNSFDYSSDSSPNLDFDSFVDMQKRNIMNAFDRYNRDILVLFLDQTSNNAFGVQATPTNIAAIFIDSIIAKCLQKYFQDYLFIVYDGEENYLIEYFTDIQTLNFLKEVCVQIILMQSEPSNFLINMNSPEYFIILSDAKSSEIFDYIFLRYLKPRAINYFRGLATAATAFPGQGQTVGSSGGVSSDYISSEMDDLGGGGRTNMQIGGALTDEQCEALRQILQPDFLSSEKMQDIRKTIETAYQQFYDDRGIEERYNANYFTYFGLLPPDIQGALTAESEDQNSKLYKNLHKIMPSPLDSFHRSETKGMQSGSPVMITATIAFNRFIFYLSEFFKENCGKLMKARALEEKKQQKEEQAAQRKAESEQRKQERLAEAAQAKERAVSRQADRDAMRDPYPGEYNDLQSAWKIAQIYTRTALISLGLCENNVENNGSWSQQALALSTDGSIQAQLLAMEAQNLRELSGWQRIAPIYSLGSGNIDDRIERGIFELYKDNPNFFYSGLNIGDKLDITRDISKITGTFEPQIKAGKKASLQASSTNPAFFVDNALQQAFIKTNLPELTDALNNVLCPVAAYCDAWNGAGCKTKRGNGSDCRQTSEVPVPNGGFSFKIQSPESVNFYETSVDSFEDNGEFNLTLGTSLNINGQLYSFVKRCDIQNSNLLGAGYVLKRQLNNLNSYFCALFNAINGGFPITNSAVWEVFRTDTQNGTNPMLRLVQDGGAKSLGDIGIEMFGLTAARKYYAIPDGVGVENNVVQYKARDQQVIPFDNNRPLLVGVTDRPSYGRQAVTALEALPDSDINEDAMTLYGSTNKLYGVYPPSTWQSPSSSSSLALKASNSNPVRGFGGVGRPFGGSNKTKGKGKGKGKIRKTIRKKKNVRKYKSLKKSSRKNNSIINMHTRKNKKNYGKKYSR
jgi:hypothetical protein